MTSRRSISLAKLAVKCVLGALVLWAVGRQILQTWNDFRAKGGGFTIDPKWVAAAGVLYLAGLCLCGLFYDRILRLGVSPIALVPALRAYLVSHLGKYVPGKAMVVVMRVTMSTPYGARASTAAYATFYETFVMMAAGAIVATLGYAASSDSARAISLASGPIDHIALLPCSLALAVLFVVLIHPRVFTLLAKGFSTPFPAISADAMPAFSTGLLITGLLLTGLAWLLLGLSQVAVIRSITPQPIRMEAMPPIIACVALATVAGFVVAIFPGGLVIREGIIMAALAPAVGNSVAVVAAIGLRLTWIAAELAAAACLMPIRMRRTEPAGT